MTSLSSKLAARHAAGQPIRVGLIGAGKFGSMFLSQVHHTPGMHLVGIADLSPQRAVDSLARVNFPRERYSTSLDSQPSVADAAKSGSTTTITSSAEDLIRGVEVVLECTGSPVAGIKHALLACESGTHIVMVNVEADVLAGPLLARKARDAGIIYSMAYGDQPAEIAELVDWARTAGFKVVCAGKGTKHLPEYHWSTPDTVWDHYGFTKEQLASGDFNAQMFNSFLDGTKSALEMAAVANACDLAPPEGLKFPPCGADGLSTVLRPADKGGVLDHSGTVEVVSCLELDGKNVENDLRWGVYVVIEAGSEYTRECFSQYGLKTDESGWYAAQYRPFHLIGMELGMSVASIALRQEPTGQTKTFAADVVAHAKRDLKSGEALDGEGGYTVFGKIMPAAKSLQVQGLPIGLAHGMTLKKEVKQGGSISWEDVEYDASSMGVKVRKEMESMFRQSNGATNSH